MTAAPATCRYRESLAEGGCTAGRCETSERHPYGCMCRYLICVEHGQDALTCNGITREHVVGALRGH